MTYCTFRMNARTYRRCAKEEVEEEEVEEKEEEEGEEEEEEEEEEEIQAEEERYCSRCPPCLEVGGDLVGGVLDDEHADQPAAHLHRGVAVHVRVVPVRAARVVGHDLVRVRERGGRLHLAVVAHVGFESNV